MIESPKRILILMSDTGGGHRSVAEAIADALVRYFPNRYQVVLTDAIVRSAVFPFNHAATLYFYATQYARSSYGALYHWSSHPRMSGAALRFLNLVMGRGLRRLLREQSVDLVVSVHPLLTTAPQRALHSFGSRSPFVVVVSDLFDAHPLWFDREAELYCVPTEKVYERARRFGFPPEKLRLVGLPVSPSFLEAVPSCADGKQKWRAQLGLDPERTTALLVGGGEGMGPLYAIARAIARARLPLQLVVIAGRNKKLYQKLVATQWEIPLSIQRFVRNMPEWMRASDVIITKAGPGTISEALACGLPMLLSGYLPGQEEGNVHFVVEEGIGVLRQEPEEITRTLCDWLAPGNDALARMAARARQLARPRAALDIAEILNGILTAPTIRI